MGIFAPPVSPAASAMIAFRCRFHGHLRSGSIIAELYCHEPALRSVQWKYPVCEQCHHVEPINPVAQALFSSSLYPAATASGRQNNATYVQNSLLNSDQYDIKVDFNATEKDHLFGRYSHAKQHNPTINSFALIGHRVFRRSDR